MWTFASGGDLPGSHDSIHVPHSRVDLREEVRALRRRKRRSATRSIFQITALRRSQRLYAWPRPSAAGGPQTGTPPRSPSGGAPGAGKRSPSGPQLRRRASAACSTAPPFGPRLERLPLALRLPPGGRVRRRPEHLSSGLALGFAQLIRYVQDLGGTPLSPQGFRGDPFQHRCSATAGSRFGTASSTCPYAITSLAARNHRSRRPPCLLTPRPQRNR